MTKFYEGYSDQDPDVTACYCLNGEMRSVSYLLTAVIGVMEFLNPIPNIWSVITVGKISERCFFLKQILHFLVQ